MPVCFTPFFPKTPCQYTPLLNLRPLNFRLTFFAWLISSHMPLFLWDYYFDLHLSIYPHFSGTQIAHKRMPWCSLRLPSMDQLSIIDKNNRMCCAQKENKY
jgi:hypothetical protein